MVPITKNLVPSEKYNIKCPYEMVPEELCIHNTANDAPASNEVAYMIRNNKKTSFHWAVDDTSIVQGIPENRNAFHAGDGSEGRGNRKALSIEICYSKGGGKRFDNAEKNAAEFAAFILQKYGWGIDKLKKHQDYSGKYCPHRTLDMGWNRFVKMVEANLKKCPFIDIKSNHWAFNAVMNLFNRNIVEGVGDNKINPTASVTRAEIATMLYRTIRELLPNTKDDIISQFFIDVPESHWAYEEIHFLNNRGIIEYRDSRTFRPGDNATRSEVAAMARYTMNYFGRYSVAHIKPPFPDVADTHPAYNLIYDLYNMGIITGYSDGTFGPDRKVSRAEAIVIVSRLLTFITK